MKVNNDIISSDYTIKAFKDAGGQYTRNPSAKGLPFNIPFRMLAPGPVNIRKQEADKAYKTFLGEQQN